MGQESQLSPSNDAQFATQTVAYTGTAGSVTGWAAGPSAVRVLCTTNAYVVVGDVSIVATATNGIPVAANVPETISVPPNLTGWRVSAIQIASGGSLYAKPLA